MTTTPGLTIALGDTLTNGAVIVGIDDPDQYGARTILAVHATDEYVVWLVSKDGHLYSGEYFELATDALYALWTRADGTLSLLTKALRTRASYSHARDAVVLGTCVLCAAPHAPYQRAGDVFQCHWHGAFRTA